MLGEGVCRGFANQFEVVRMERSGPRQRDIVLGIAYFFTPIKPAKRGDMRFEAEPVRRTCGNFFEDLFDVECLDPGHELILLLGFEAFQYSNAWHTRTDIRPLAVERKEERAV